jgi:hypothetical protein
MKLTLGRRALLRGAGAAIALPALESLLPSKAASQMDDPKRMVVLFFPNGSDNHREWNPTGTGTGYTLGDCHASLAPYKSELTMLRNVNNTYVTGAPAHSRATAAFLTATRITDQYVARVGKSIDQVVADQVGAMTPISSLQLGPTPYASGSEPQDTGWSPTYNLHISWASASVFNPVTEDVRAVFDRLFTGPDPDQVLAERRRRYRRSILDYALDETTRLSARVGSADRLKLDEYLTALRAVELRIDTATAPPSSACESATTPPGSVAFPEHTRLMLDLIVLALRCDMTRVVTYQMDYGFGNKDFAFLVGGTRQLHHNITHTGTTEAPLKHRMITGWYCEQLAYFLGQMTSVAESTGTLLDNSLVLFGSGLGSGRSHSGNDMTLILAGRAQGALSPGRLVDAGGAPHDRLLLSMLQTMDVPATSFGAATTPLSGL